MCSRWSRLALWGDARANVMALDVGSFSKHLFSCVGDEFEYLQLLDHLEQERAFELWHDSLGC